MLAKPVAPLAHGTDFTPEEFVTLVRLARRAIRGSEETRRALQDLKVNIVPATFYSSIPLLSDMDTSFEFDDANGPYNSPKVFDRERMLKFLDEIGEFALEFDPPVDGDVSYPQNYFWRNPAFSFSDAMAYYCIIRYFQPARVLEIGSGFSTLVALQALERNGTGELICIEPFPSAWLKAQEDRLTLYDKPVQVFGPEFFNDNLSDGDILFIDSTHTVKAGSDCLHIYLRILPELKSNLIVHAHDIYLPFPLDKAQGMHKHVYWTEQYLLYAYLLDNSRTMVLFGSRYHYNLNREHLDRFMRDRWQSGGGSFWFSQSGAT